MVSNCLSKLCRNRTGQPFHTEPRTGRSTCQGAATSRDGRQLIAFWASMAGPAMAVPALVAMTGFTKRNRLVSTDQQRALDEGGRASFRTSQTTNGSRSPSSLRLVLPQYNHGQISSAIPASEVTKVCLRLRHLVQECVPCEMEETRVTTPHSSIITPKVVQAAKEAGGTENKGCVV